MSAAAGLREQLTALVLQGNNRLLVDLSEVEIVDSSGLAALVAGLKAARQAGGDLKIASANRQVSAAIELTNLHLVLQSADIGEAALDRPT